MLRHPDWAAQPDDRKAMILKQGGGLLLHLFKANGSDNALDQAIAILTMGANLLDDGDPERPAHLANLGLATRLAGERSGDIAVVRRAVAIYRASVALSHPDDVDLPKRLSNLGSALKTEYEMSGDAQSMDASIDAFTAACVRNSSPDIASNLAMGLRDRHIATGRRSDLEQAIALLRAAVAETAPEHPGLAVRLNNLSIVHAQRFELDRQDADAKAALDALTRLVNLTPGGSPQRGYRLFNLANLHRRLFGVNADRRAIAEAARLYSEALAISSYGPEGMAMLRSGYADALSVLAGLNEDVEQSEKAIALARLALGGIAPGNVERLSYASSLAQALQRHGRITRDASPLREAEALLGQAAEAQRHRPAAVLLLTNRARVAEDLFALTEDEEDARRAADMGRESIAALQAQAIEGSLERANVEIAAQSAISAALMLLAIGDAGQAAELLERGRTARLTAEAFAAQAEQSDTSTMAADRARLRARIRTARVELEQLAGDGIEPQQRRAAIAAGLEQDLAALKPLIAATTGGVPDAADLRALAGRLDAALVYVFAHDGTAGAILVTADGFEAIALPLLADIRVRLHSPGGASGASASRSPPGWFPAYRAAFGDDATAAGGRAWPAVLRSTLDWLGEAFAAPLHGWLAGDTRRLLLLPVGELAALPLHAAVVTGGTPLCATLACRYAPSAALLDLASRRPKPQGGVAALADSMGDLPFSRLEAWSVTPDALLGKDVTHGAISAALRQAARTHLAVHGEFDQENPLGSAFVAADEPVRLGDLLAGRIEVASGATVIAAACETGLFDTRVGASEQIGFAAALIAAGASEVLTTLWPIHDLSTALIMERASSLSLRDGVPFAQALDAAVDWLRSAPGSAVAEALDAIARRLPEVEVEARDLLDEARSALEGLPGPPFADPRFWAGFALSGVGHIGS